MHCNNLRLILALGLVRVSSRVSVRIRIKVRVSVMVRVSIRTSWVVNFALFRCYRPVIYTRPQTVHNVAYLSPSSILWCRLIGGDALRLGRQPWVWRRGHILQTVV